ncbi:MAG: hypothetical protein R3C05_05630 [Pirellulaceae bacterium]
MPKDASFLIETPKGRGTFGRKPDRTELYTSLHDAKLLLASVGVHDVRGRPGTRGGFDVRACGLVGYNQLYESIMLKEAIANWTKATTIKSLGNGIFSVSYFQNRQRVTIYVTPCKATRSRAWKSTMAVK